MSGLDPVTTKELQSVSRRWQTYVGRCLYVGITAYILYGYWKEVWRGEAGSLGTVSVSRYALLGREIFVRCEWVSLALTALAAVLAGADMIAKEIRTGTLGLLFLTPLTPHQVVFGKWKGAMMIATALYLCSLPVLAIAVYLGGVGAVDLARSAALALGLAAVGAAMSIYFSSRLKSGGASVAVTIPLLLLTLAAFGVADFFGNLVLQMAFGSRSLHHAGGIATLLVTAFLCTLLLDKTVRHLRERTGAIPGPVELARERRALALEEVRDQRASTPRRILRTWRAVWEESPLMWKEFTLRPALRVREDWRAKVYILLFGIFFLSWFMADFDRGHGFFHLWGAFYTVVALAGGCLLFAPEKEGRQWLLLLSTPVTAVQIVRAKLLCGLLFPEGIGLIFLYLMVLMAWLGFQRMETIGAVTGTATLFILFAYALSAAASLRAKTARGAFLFAAGIVAFLVTAPPLLSAAVRPLRLVHGFAWNEAWNWFEALDPVTVLESFELGDRYPRAMPPLAFERALRFVTLYLPVTLLLPVEMVLRFRRIALGA